MEKIERSRLLISMVVLMALLMGALPVLAQGDEATETPPVVRPPRVPISEDTFFQLFLPTIAVESPVFEAWQHKRTWAFFVFTEEAGHLQYTAYPGEGGNVVIGGHYELTDFSPGPFYELDQLEEGDLIDIYYLGELFTYEVIFTELVDPTNLSVVAPTPIEMLTLLTCYDYSSIADTYEHRYVVRAALVAGPDRPRE